jgi:hypothetical protein
MTYSFRRSCVWVALAPGVAFRHARVAAAFRPFPAAKGFRRLWGYA